MLELWLALLAPRPVTFCYLQAQSVVFSCSNSKRWKKGVLTSKGLPADISSQVLTRNTHKCTLYLHCLNSFILFIFSFICQFIYSFNFNFIYIVLSGGGCSLLICLFLPFNSKHICNLPKYNLPRGKVWGRNLTSFLIWMSSYHNSNYDPFPTGLKYCSYYTQMSVPCCVCL